MDHDELRSHIESSRGPESPALLGLARIVASCWPGGSTDRTERAALNWVRRWRPEKAGTPIPVCSCAVGHCALCN
jgi:hypothetical protein